MSYPLSFEMFMTHGKILAPWVLFLEQESYLSYIDLDYKNVDYKITLQSSKIVYKKL